MSCLCTEKLLVNIEKGLTDKEYEFSMDEIDEKLLELKKELRFNYRYRIYYKYDLVLTY